MKQLAGLITVIVLFSTMPVSAIEKEINISGSWVLDRDASDINRASNLMEHEDLIGNVPIRDMGNPRGGSKIEAIPGNRPGSSRMPGNSPGPAPKPRETTEGNFPGRSDWQDLELTLIISQTEEVLEVIHRYSFENEDKHIVQTFSLKGGQDVNVMRSGRGKFYSETTIENGKIINQGIHRVSTPTDDRSTTLKEEYSLADDGKALILKANRITPEGVLSARMVFRNKSEVTE